MTPRKLVQQPLYLEPSDAESLDRLSAETGAPKQKLLREAVSDLFGKYRTKGFLKHKAPVTQAAELVDFLQDVALGKRKASMREVNRAAKELSKYLPDA